MDMPPSPHEEPYMLVNDGFRVASVERIMQLMFDWAEMSEPTSEADAMNNHLL